jgi:hypothetical protein
MPVHLHLYFSLQMLSLLPARIIRLLEFIGFSGNRVKVAFCFNFEEISVVLCYSDLLHPASFQMVFSEECLFSWFEINTISSTEYSPILPQMRRKCS